MSKGSKRRPLLVSKDEFEANWSRTFEGPEEPVVAGYERQFASDAVPKSPCDGCKRDLHGLTLRIRSMPCPSKDGTELQSRCPFCGEWSVHAFYGNTLRR